jgi:hypothetical protein
MTRLAPSIDDLVDEVCDAAGDDAAARLHAASDARGELTKTGDALVEQFVVQARADGLSWTRIAALLGMNRRAAQKRYAVVCVLSGTWPGELADRFAGP